MIKLSLWENVRAFSSSAWNWHNKLVLKLPETILKIKKGKYTIKVYNKDENEKNFFLSDKIIYACEGKNRTQTNFHRKIIYFFLCWMAFWILLKYYKETKLKIELGKFCFAKSFPFEWAFELFKLIRSSGILINTSFLIT